MTILWLLQKNYFATLRTQLDCLSATRTRIINLPTNQKGYDTFETTVGKVSARRIRFCPVHFCLGIILKVIQYNFQGNAGTKIDPEDLNSPRRDFSNGGLKSVVTLLVRWQINVLSARIGRPIQL